METPMKNSLFEIRHIGVSLLISHLVLFTSVASAQTSCDGWNYGLLGGAISGTIEWRLDQYCNSNPQDLVGTVDGIVVTTHNVYTRGTSGGTASCTNYPKQIVITLSRPVADFQVEVFGAKTVSANTGQTLHFSPQLEPEGSYAPGRPVFASLAYFSGGGITSITISDPFEYPVYWPNGSLYNTGCWEMWFANARFNSESRHNQCNCARPAMARPPHTFIPSIESHDLTVVNYTNWSMDVDVTDVDGLVLRNVRLGQRYLAEKISVPYYTLETSAFPKQRGELKPNSTDASMRSRLVSFYITSDADKLVIEAAYIIDQIPAGSQSCLHITQRYEFYNIRVGDNCEPSSTLPCARWKPIVTYRFFGQGGDVLRSISIPQRQHLTVDGNTYNSIGLFRDSDDVPRFANKFNPLFGEWRDYIIVSGHNAYQWDNIHETYKGIIEEPTLRLNPFEIPVFGFVQPGCSECSHSHWRWGKYIPSAEGGGQLIGIPAGSNQDMAIAVVLNQANEEHPTDYVGLVQFGAPIRTFSTAGRNALQIYRDSAPEDVVFWQVGTGYQNYDTFFGHGGFFNPDEQVTQLYQDSSSQDSVSAVSAAHIYAESPTTVESFDSNQAVPLPPGYAVYNNLSKNVKADDEASSGPYSVTFYVPSVSDQTTFDNLRVFHLEPDPFDSTNIVWVDRTIIPPDPQAPNFGSGTLSAKVNSTGLFVLALLTQPQPPNMDVADLSVSTNQSSDPVTAGGNPIYTINIGNNGPQSATGITLSAALAPNESFVSANSSQGICSAMDGSVVCKLGTLAVNSSGTVNVTVKITDEGMAIPPASQTIASTVHVQANESDSNPGDNTFVLSTTVLPDPNAAPTVRINSPIAGTLFVAPATITIDVTATDSDGSVNVVELYGDGDLLGLGTITGQNQYSLVWNNVSAGNHSLVAVARDNLGKERASEPIGVTINGTAIVNITSPTWWAGAFNRPANVQITATASLSGGTISKVDFYANEYLIGTGTLTGPDQYGITWTCERAGNYALTAVATDDSSVTTTSSPMNIIVNDPPIVCLINPSGGALFTAPASVTLTANASDGDGSIRQVDFYSNGSLIGTSQTVGANQFNITWASVAAGSYSLTAVATDNLGGTSTSAPVNVIVNAPPTVTLTGPTNDTVFAPPASMTLMATASDSDGSVTNVSFYSNGNMIGSGTFTAPNQYSFTWSNVGVGSYLLSARATDDRGANTTSNYAGITVNSPPTLSITSPTNGSTFAAPASITINATAADNDGFISKVEFFQNSLKIGEDTTAPYSFTWSGVSPGSYTLTAVATDNVGSATTSSPISITVSRSALFVTGSTTLNSAETTVKTRLQNLGYVVTVKDAKSSVSGDATGRTVVVISSTATSSSLSTKFTNVSTPVVIWQPLSFADMGMIPTGNSNRGTTTGQTQVKVVLPTHALAGGLTGTQTVVTASSTFSWGKPNANAAAVATLVSDTTKTIIFGYTQGASMPGLVAPARRVGFFMSDTTAASFNSNGWTLFDAAINWATSSAP
jgi:Bacterial Ig domain/Domain of unknown function DUF11